MVSFDSSVLLSAIFSHQCIVSQAHFPKCLGMHKPCYNKAPWCKTLGACHVIRPRAMHACAVNTSQLDLRVVLNNAHKKPRSLYSTSTLLVTSQSSYEKYNWIYMYTLLWLKVSHRCPFCTLRVQQEAKNTEMIKNMSP